MTVYDADWYALVEAEHEFQNPVSAASLCKLGEELRLGPSSRVLDVACGRCGPALLLAREFGCRLWCVDNQPAFVDAARARIAHAELEERINLLQADASLLEVTEPGYWDAAICLGASFVFGGLAPTLQRLSAAAPLVAVGEPYLKLSDTLALAESAGATVVETIVSSEQDWLEYEAQRMRTLLQWLQTHPEYGDDFRAREREAQRRRRRERRGWAILVCRV